MVEWKKLGEVCRVLRGKRLTKSQLSETEGYPVLHGGSSPMGYYKEFNRKANTTVVVNTGNAGSVFFYDKEFWSSDACYALYPNDSLIDKFLYLYVLGCERLLKGRIRAGAMPTIDADAIKSLVIPVPSIAEQTRIVGILDTFTASIENLKQQIAQRRKQYEHYRDQLLDLEGKEGVEMKRLGEVCYKISAGKNKAKNKTGQYPVFGSTGIIAYANSYVYDTARILVARVGANAGFVYESYGKYDVTDNTLIVFLKDGICQKYVFHRLVRENINKYAKGGGQPLITASLLKDITILVPSLAEQQRIVSILDTFEASIANLEQQLAQREKQYEYYRNKLLTFE